MYRPKTRFPLPNSHIAGSQRIPRLPRVAFLFFWPLGSCSPPCSERAPGISGFRGSRFPGQPHPGAVRSGMCAAGSRLGTALEPPGNRLGSAWEPPGSRRAGASPAPREQGQSRGCVALAVTAGGSLAYLWSQRFLLRLSDSQDAVAAWSLELICMRQGPPRSEGCSRSSLQSCHTHTGSVSALA